MVDNIAPIMEDVSARVVAAMTAEGRKPGRVVAIAPGTNPAWDGDCDGYLYGRIVTITPVPAANAAPNVRCNVHFWVATLAIAITRCVAVLDNKGRAPLPAAVDADGHGFSQDASIIRDALLCAPDTRSIVQGVSLEEQGGYSGFEWTYTVRVPVCACIDVE